MWYLADWEIVQNVMDVWWVLLIYSYMQLIYIYMIILNCWQKFENEYISENNHFKCESLYW